MWLNQINHHFHFRNQQHNQYQQTTTKLLIFLLLVTLWFDEATSLSTSSQTPPLQSPVVAATLSASTLPTEQIIKPETTSIPTSTLKLTTEEPRFGPRDEIYIDDEGLEGSGGGRNEIHDDLEKEPEYSGSGFGPDDEDSRPSHKQPETNTNSKNSLGVSRVGGAGTEQEIGSGEGPDIVFEDDDSDEDDDDEDVGIGHKDDHSTKPDNTKHESTTIHHHHHEDNLDVQKTKIDGKEKPSVEIDLETEQKIPAVEKPASGGETTIFGETGVIIMNTKSDDRSHSFFAQPGILAAVIGGAVVGLLCAILVVMFIVYRMRKKDEGSYALDEPKRSPAVNSYAKNANNREFYA